MTASADTLTRTRLRQEMVCIWRECLQTNDISAEDDFFALGGSSVQAAQIFARLTPLTGRALPLSALYAAPRLEDLVGWILRDGDPGAETPQVSGQARVVAGAGHARTVFLVPGLEGGIVGLAHLAGALSDELRVVALAPRGREDGERPCHDIDTIAAEFIADARTLQPHGPYALAGLCWGGVVALEMARQLRAAREDVRLLALVDPPPVGGARTALAAAWLDALATANFVRDRIGQSARDLLRTPAGGRLKFLRGRLGVMGDIARHRDAFRGDRAERARYLTREAHRRSLQRYRLRPADGEATLIFSRERNADTSRACRQNWLAHFGAHARVHEVPGRDSGDAVSHTNAAHVARVLREALAATG